MVEKGSAGTMPINPPNSIFKRIVAGKLILKPEQFKAQKTKNGLILPRFGPKQAGRLRAKLLKIGIDPVKVGMPPLPPPNTTLKAWPEITYSDAMKEVKYSFHLVTISYTHLVGLILLSSKWPK